MNFKNEASGMHKPWPPAIRFVESNETSEEKCKNLLRGFRYLLTYSGLDCEKAEPLSDHLTYQIFPLYQHDSKNKKKRAASRIIEYMLFSMTGLIVSYLALRNVFDENVQAFVNLCEQEDVRGLVYRFDYNSVNIVPFFILENIS